MKKINWSKWPNYKSAEKQAIIRVIKSNQITSQNEVEKFENEFKNYIKIKYAKCVGNATQGLHLALNALNVGVGDEVIVTNFSWISTASCILMQNAVPIFCDIENKSFGIDVEKLKKKITSRTKAIIYVHMYGFICDVEKLLQISKKFKIPLIEDASHAHGSEFNKIKAGNFSSIAVFSLQQRKNLPAGEGCVIVTNNKRLDKKIYNYRSFGAKELSYNYRMTEFCAAIARERLKKLDIENKLRNKYALYIFNKCKNLQGISFLKPRNKSFSCFHKLIILYNYNYFKKNINFFFNFIKKTGVPIEKVYKPLNTHAHFNPEVLPSRGIPWKWKIYSNNFRLPLKMKKLNFEVTNLYSKKILLQVSLNPLLRKRDLEYFCDKIIKYNNKYKKEID